MRETRPMRTSSDPRRHGIPCLALATALLGCAGGQAAGSGERAVEADVGSSAREEALSPTASASSSPPVASVAVPAPPATLVDAGAAVVAQQDPPERPIRSGGPCAIPAGAPVAFSPRPWDIGRSGSDAIVPSGPGKRTVRFRVGHHPGASIGWVVATPSEVVIGARLPAYCGGAAPPEVVLEVELPASGKPVKIVECHVGTCTGPPRP
jgi:hypothetical protein